jgi:FkbM family methyltransferase
VQIKPIRGASALRALNRVLPLGRHWSPIIRLLNRSDVLVAFPYAGHELLLPGSQPKKIAQYHFLAAHEFEDYPAIVSQVEPLDQGVVVEVGGSFGQLTLLLRDHTDLPLIVFEPDPVQREVLSLTLERNGLRAVDLRAVACGSESGTVQFAQSGNQAVLAQGEGTPVPVRRLDDELSAAGRIAYLMIDCEGYEADVLRGAETILRRDRPLVHVEVHPRFLERYGSSATEVIDLLRPRYDLKLWSLHRRWPRTRLARSILKYRKPRPYVFADAEEFLAAAEAVTPDWKAFVEATPKPHLTARG